MAKKYLLYIHDPLFENETKKSELINNLLERHYHDTVDGGKTQEDIHTRLKRAQEALRQAETPKTDRFVLREDGQIVGPITLNEPEYTPINEPTYTPPEDMA